MLYTALAYKTMRTPEFPTSEQMLSMAGKIEKNLSLKAINKYIHQPKKSGLTFAFILIKDRIETPVNPYRIPETEEEIEIVNDIYIEQLKDIKSLKSVEARTIAVLCVDWLNGQNNGDWVKMKIK